MPDAEIFIVYFEVEPTHFLKADLGSTDRRSKAAIYDSANAAREAATNSGLGGTKILPMSWVEWQHWVALSL